MKNESKYEQDKVCLPLQKYLVRGKHPLFCSKTLVTTQIHNFTNIFKRIYQLSQTQTTCSNEQSDLSDL